jgi:hypothetical protein
VNYNAPHVSDNNRVVINKKDLKSAIHKKDLSQYCYLQKILHKNFIESQCDQKEYLHFYSKSETTLGYKKNLEIGSFNLKHLGNSRFKNLEAMAQIINKWDIVAALELDDFSKTGIFQRHNNRQAKKGTILYSSRKYQEAYQSIIKLAQPGFLKLLNLLNLRYPRSNWSFVLSKVPADVGGSQELIGYFYKSHLVRLKKSSACPLRSPACILTFTGSISTLKKAVAKPAFITRFQSSNNDLTLFASHFRFSAPEESLTEWAVEKINTLENNLFDKFNVSSRVVHRYVELYMHLKQINYLKKKRRLINTNYIFLGDLNLSYKSRNHKEAWDKIIDSTLKDTSAFIDSETTLSITGNFSNSYDHFLFNPRKLTRCVANNKPSVFNYIYDETLFTENLHYMIIKLKTLRGLSVPRLISKFKRHRFWSKQKLFYNYTLNELIQRYSASSSFLSNLVTMLKARLIDSQFDTNAPFKSYIETMSDHLPIQMSCANT